MSRKRYSIRYERNSAPVYAVVLSVILTICISGRDGRDGRKLNHSHLSILGIGHVLYCMYVKFVDQTVHSVTPGESYLHAPSLPNCRLKEMKLSTFFHMYIYIHDALITLQQTEVFIPGFTAFGENFVNYDLMTWRMPSKATSLSKEICSNAIPLRSG